MDLHRKSEIELKYFLERRLVAVASGSSNNLNHQGFDDLPRPKNKYQQKQSAANKNSSQQSRLKKSSSCNELVLQFEQHLRQQGLSPPTGQFQPSALFQGRKSQMTSEVFVDPAQGRQPRRPLLANRDIFEKQLDNNLRRAPQPSPPDPVQRIVNQHSQNLRHNEKLDGSNKELDKSSNPHKVVIYFGDSIGNNRRTTSGSVGDLVFASRANDEGFPKRRNEARLETNDVMKQLKSVLEEKKTHKDTKVFIKPAPPPPPPPIPGKLQASSSSVDNKEVNGHNNHTVDQSGPTKPPKEKPPRKDKQPKQSQPGNNSSNNSKVDTTSVDNKEQLSTANNNNKNNHENEMKAGKSSVDLPDFVESVTNGVINIKIDGSYNVARELVESVAMEASGSGGKGNQNEMQAHDEPQSFDWSFVQEWRSR